MTLQIITNYTPRSHILCGEALKDVYVDFRVSVLRTVEWATWHSKLNSLPGGKGWCIRKSNLQDLIAELVQRQIPYEILDHVKIQKPKVCASTLQRSKKEKKGPKTAYSFFAKEKWAEAKILLDESDRRHNGKISKMVAKMWKEVRTGPTKWHVMAEEARLEFEKVKELKSSLESSRDSNLVKFPVNYISESQRGPRFAPQVKGYTLDQTEEPFDQYAKFLTYKEKWNSWVANKPGGRSYETEMIDRGFLFSPPLGICIEERHSFFIWDNFAEYADTLTIMVPSNSPADLVFRKAWEKEISEHIQEGSTWKSFTQANKKLYTLNTLEKISKYSNHLETLMKKYPEWEWDMKGLSRNSSLSWSFVEAHPEWKWNMGGLSRNSSLPWSFVEAHPEWKWDMEGLSRNPSLPWSFVEAHPEWEWDMGGLSQNSSLAWSFVEAHPEWKWNMFWLSRNSSLPWSFVDAHPEWEWDMGGLSQNSSLPWSFLEAHPEWKWDMEGLSQNSSLSWSFVEAHPDLKWDMGGLSWNPSLPWNFVEAHPKWKWNVGGLSWNPSLPWSFVDAHPEWKWDMGGLSRNSSLSWSFVEAHPEWEWDMGGLSQNSSLPWSFLEAHPEWKWDMEGLSRNPSLPWSFVEAHPEWKWNMFWLSRNSSLPWRFVEAHPEWKWDMKGLSWNKFKN